MNTSRTIRSDKPWQKMRASDIGFSFIQRVRKLRCNIDYIVKMYNILV